MIVTNCQFRYHKTYSKRTNSWSAEPIKEPKAYAYLDALLGSIMEERIADKGLMQRGRALALGDPRRMVLYTAKVPAPPKEDLIRDTVDKSRFNKISC